jgi:TolB protein
MVVTLLGLLGFILVGSGLVQATSFSEMMPNPNPELPSSGDSRLSQPDDLLPEQPSFTLTPAAFLPFVAAEHPKTRGMIAFERHISADAPHDIWMMYHDGTRQENLTNSPDAVEGVPTWSPDGNFLAFESAPVEPANSNRAIYKMNMQTREVIQLTNRTHDDYWPAWSPNGDKIAFMRRIGGSPPDIYVMNIDGTNQTQLTDWTYGDEFPAWSADGSQIAFSSDREYAGRDLYVMWADGTHERQLLQTVNQDELYPSWGPDGLIYYTFQLQKKPQKQEWLYRIDPNTVNRVQVFNDEYNRYIASWAPDGQCFVFYSTMGDRDGTDKEIWKWCNGFTNPINLTNNDVGDEYSAWSPVP